MGSSFATVVAGGAAALAESLRNIASRVFAMFKRTLIIYKVFDNSVRVKERRKRGVEAILTSVLHSAMTVLQAVVVDNTGGGLHQS